MHGQDTCESFFDDVRVPRSNGVVPDRVPRSCFPSPLIRSGSTPRMRSGSINAVSSGFEVRPDEVVVFTLCRLVPGKWVDLVLDAIDIQGATAELFAL